MRGRRRDAEQQRQHTYDIALVRGCPLGSQRALLGPRNERCQRGEVEDGRAKHYGRNLEWIVVNRLELATDAIFAYAVPVYFRAGATVVSEVRLDGAAGPAAVSTRAGISSYVDFVPSAELAANTSYTLTVVWAPQGSAPS
jgi:hypothetical protein